MRLVIAFVCPANQGLHPSRGLKPIRYSIVAQKAASKGEAGERTVLQGERPGVPTEIPSNRTRFFR